MKGARQDRAAQDHAAEIVDEIFAGLREGIQAIDPVVLAEVAARLDRSGSLPSPQEAEVWAAYLAGVEVGRRIGGAR